MHSFSETREGLCKPQVDSSPAPYPSLSLFSLGVSCFRSFLPHGKRNRQDGALTYEDQDRDFGPRTFPKMMLAGQLHKRGSESGNPGRGGSGARKVTEKSNSSMAFQDHQALCDSSAEKMST